MAEITIDEKTILKIIGDHYGVPSMYVCIGTDYKFVRQGDDKVRKNYLYGIVHIDDSNTKQHTIDPDDTDPQKEVAKYVTAFSAGYDKGIEDAQPSPPEIVRCNACKHWEQTSGQTKGFGLGKCEFHKTNNVICKGYCYWAERRR